MGIFSSYVKDGLKKCNEEILNCENDNNKNLNQIKKCEIEIEQRNIELKSLKEKKKLFLKEIKNACRR